MKQAGRSSVYLCTFLCSILFVLSVFVSDVNAKYSTSSHRHTSHGSHHSYPKHSSSSGSRVSHGSHHSYPVHQGLSGSSGSHGSHHSYPEHGGLSGSSSGKINHHSNNPTYPWSNQMSGNTPSGIHNSPSGRLSNNHPSSYYPPSNGLPGNAASGNSYSSSGSAHPSNTYQSWRSNQNVYHNTNSHTVVHNHYSYSPPTVIHYRTSHGVSPMSYPVYTGIPPTYVYEYRSSGNKYSYLLAGLALYNLGRMSSNSNYNYYHTHYQRQPNERCLFGVRYNTGAVEEMAIECAAITYFIYESTQVPQMQPQTQTNVVKQTTITTQTLSSNGTLINGVVVPNTQQLLNSNGQINTQQINTVTTTTTEVNDPRLLGNPVQVNPNMICYVKRTTLISHFEKPVPCGLLHEYAASSLRKNSGVMVQSCLTSVLIAVTLLLY